MTLTENEFEKAEKERNKYYLYVVREDKTIYVLKNPAKHCIQRLVPYYVVQKWSQLAKSVPLG